MSDYDIRLDADGLPETPESVHGLTALGHSLTAPANPLQGLRL